MTEYFPSSYPKGRQCDREYMFNIGNTLHSKIVSEIIQHALKQRHAAESENADKQAILMSDHWI